MTRSQGSAEERLDAIVQAKAERDLLKKAVLDWMDAEGRAGRLRTNGDAPMWQEYATSVERVVRLTEAL